MNDSDSFFGSTKTSGDGSRPRAVNPHTGQEQSWQRASNYAAPLDNPHGLIKWQLRELVKGLSQRPDLARMLLTGAAIEDNAKADEIIVQAHAVAAIAAKANEGTAVHTALSRSFLGHEVPQEYMPHIRAFAAELQRYGLTPVATEVRVLCVLLGVLGHTDWIVKTADGRHLILDVKTGRLGDARKFAVQCKAYGASEYIDDGNNGWVPIPFTIDQTEAIIAHVDPLTGATALYRVDLLLGLYGAALAERVREWGKIEVLSPYVPNLTQSGTPTLFGQRVDMRDEAGTPVTNAHGGSEESLRRVEDRMPSPIDPVGAPAGFLQTPTAWLESMGPGYQVRSDDAWATPMTKDEFLQRYSPQHDGSTTRATNEHGGSVPVNAGRSFDDLMKLDKAPLQMIIKNEFGGTDLAHNRRWLARWIVATQNGADKAAAAKYAAAKDDDEPATSAPVPVAAAHELGDLSFIFRSIEGAKSEGALEALRANIVARRGDQAWTDEMAVAARAKALQLIAADGNAVDPVNRVLAKISQANEPAHIAAIWSETTIGGSAPDAWTTVLKDAADKRLHEIQIAQGAPPANPYGPAQ